MIPLELLWVIVFKTHSPSLTVMIRVGPVILWTDENLLFCVVGGWCFFYSLNHRPQLNVDMS